MLSPPRCGRAHLQVIENHVYRDGESFSLKGDPARSKSRETLSSLVSGKSVLVVDLQDFNCPPRARTRAGPGYCYRLENSCGFAVASAFAGGATRCLLALSLDQP